jgi:hypothetical protein
MFDAAAVRDCSGPPDVSGSRISPAFAPRGKRFRRSVRAAKFGGCRRVDEAHRRARSLPIASHMGRLRSLRTGHARQLWRGWTRAHLMGYQVHVAARSGRCATPLAIVLSLR